MVFRDGRTYPPTVPTHQKVFSKVVFITLNWGNQKRCSAGNESECFLNSIRSVNQFVPLRNLEAILFEVTNQNWCIEHQNEVSELLDIGIFFAYSIVYGYTRAFPIAVRTRKNKMWRRLTGQLPYIYVYIHSFIYLVKRLPKMQSFVTAVQPFFTHKL